MDALPFPVDEGPTIVIVEKQNTRVGYPIRGSYWTGCSSWVHMTTGVHAGKYPISWLKTLTWEELQSLHSDDHENRVQWDYVRRATNNIRQTVPYCPDGRCPLQR